MPKRLKNSLNSITAERSPSLIEEPSDQCSKESSSAKHEKVRYDLHSTIIRFGRKAIKSSPCYNVGRFVYLLSYRCYSMASP